MWPYYPELLQTPVPRYTSFPTAAEFDTCVNASHLQTALAGASGDISLYIHIPYCEKICWYCGCNTGKANRRHRLTSYLDALHREITLVGASLGSGVKVTRLAFGGGSPNAITPVEFVRLLLALTQAFHLDSPLVTIELDPRTLDQEWANVLARVGVQRASLGVQTFDPDVQQAIGRVQPASMIEKCTKMLRDAGVVSLNFDLMYGLPRQDWHVLADTIDHAVTLGADRIALFGYAHIPQMIARQRQIDEMALPGLEERFAMAANGYAHLLSAGYKAIGFDHFARPQDVLAQAADSGGLRRNFQGFTDDGAFALIGLGASAISVFPDVIVQNEKNTGRYRMMLSQEKLPAERGVLRTADDQRRGAVIEQILCYGRAMPGKDLLNDVSGGLAPFLDRGLVTLKDDQLEITPAGTAYARMIASLFDPYRKMAVKRFSSAI